MNSTCKVLRLSKSSGFTLVELMITVAILAILAAVAIPMYSNYINRAKQSDAVIGLKAAQMAQEQFFSENNYYANTLTLLPGFSSTTMGEYKLAVLNGSIPGASTQTFSVAATWVDNGKGIDDCWTISDTNIAPVCDTSKNGIKGYSVFRWIFE